MTQSYKDWSGKRTPTIVPCASFRDGCLETVLDDVVTTSRDNSRTRIYVLTTNPVRAKTGLPRSLDSTMASREASDVQVPQQAILNLVHPSVHGHLVSALGARDVGDLSADVGLDELEGREVVRLVGRSGFGLEGQREAGEGREPHVESGRRRHAGDGDDGCGGCVVLVVRKRLGGFVAGGDAPAESVPDDDDLGGRV